MDFSAKLGEILIRVSRAFRDEVAPRAQPPEPQEIAEVFRALPQIEREKILSCDQARYGVGSKNEKTRVAWLEKMLAEVAAGSRILDAGAGECQFRKFCGHLNYVSQDVNLYTGQGAVGLQTGAWDNTKIDIVCDIVSVPEPDKSFDAILCTEVLEHVTDPNAALKEMARLLKAGGILILTAPFCSLTHFAPYHYSTGFNRFYYEHHLNKLGFEITDLEANGNFFEFMGQELRRVSNDIPPRYASAEPTQLERYAVQIILAMFERMSRTDTGSQEMLHFGCHVRAVKKSNV